MIKTDKKPTNPEYLNRNIHTDTTPPHRTVTCEKCGAVLSYESVHDTHVGEFGARYITCPYCDDEIMTDEDGVRITLNNLSPEHFSDFTNGVDIDFNQVKRWIDNAIEHFEYCEPDAEYYFASSGNTFVCVFKGDGDECDYSVVWCPYGYKEVELFKE